MKTKKTPMISRLVRELRVAWYALRYVRPWHWRAFRREVVDMQRKLEADLNALIITQHVVPLDEEGIKLVAETIAESLRRNLPRL
jgi:hypothetical protein